MNKILAVLIFSVLLIPATAFGAELRSGDEVSLPQLQINDDLYVGGGTIVTSAEIIGDLLAAGGTITVTGSVSGDALLLGGNIQILSPVGDDLRVAGGNILVNSRVTGDLVVAGGTVVVSPTAVILGDVVMVGGNLSLGGEVGGDIKAAGGRLNINGPVAGSADLRVDELVIGSNARIEGDVKYKSPKEANMESGAVIGGTVDFDKLDRSGVSKHEAKSGFAAFIGAVGLFKAIAFLIASLVFLGLLPRISSEIGQSSTDRFWKNLLTGLVLVIVLPIVGVLLMVTLIGIPLGVVAILAFMMLLVIGGILFPITAGSVVYRLITKKEDVNVNWKIALIGIMAWIILSLIPIFGWIMLLILYLSAVGSFGYQWTKEIWARRS